VKISNIPLDKRCEANVFYAGGLVGVSLDLEAATLHKPEYVKVLIGCRDIERIPASAEGCLGDNFYDFYYEVDKIVVGGNPKDNSNVAVGNSGAPSPKRPRFEQSNNVTEENSDTQLMSSQTESVHQGRQHENVIITDVTEEVDTQESEDDSTGGELLIETIAREHKDALLQPGMTPNKWIIPCPILNVNPLNPAATPISSLLLPSSHNLSDENWPPLPVITDVTDLVNSPTNVSSDYLVQSPELSAEDKEDDNQEEPVAPSRRVPAHANMNIMDKVEKVAKKRNLEGNIAVPISDSNSFAALSNTELMCRALKMGVHIPDNDFTAIDILRDLETSRNDLANKNVSTQLHADNLYIENNTGNSTPLSMDWIPSSDNDEPFTIVEKRGKKSARKKPVVLVSRPNTRSQANKGSPSGDKTTQIPGRVTRNHVKPNRFK
jgi:hypothetical protein